MKNINIEEVKRYLKRSLKKKVKITTSLIVLFMMSNSIVSMASYIEIKDGKIARDGFKFKEQSPESVGLNSNGGEETDRSVIGKGSVAIGYNAQAGKREQQGNNIIMKGNYSVAVGHSSKANAENSVAIGRDAEVANTENDSIAIGNMARILTSDKTGANGDAGSVAIGKNARTWLIKSTAIGIDSEVVPLKTFDKSSANGGGQGVAIGSGSKAVDQATSLGNETYAIGRSSIAIGSDDNDQ